MIDRTQLRTAAVNALKSAATLAGNDVFSPEDWATWSGKYPLVIVRTPLERKTSRGRVGAPQFDSLITVTATGRVERTSEAAAESDLETLSEQIEAALLCNGKFIYDNEVQQFAGVETHMTVTSEGKKHLGETVVAFHVEVFQVFEPTIDANGDPFPPTDQLEGIDVDADLTGTFDKTGTYTADPRFNADFANAATPAPRTTGPDGRPEAAAKIDLPQ